MEEIVLRKLIRENIKKQIIKEDFSDSLERELAPLMKQFTYSLPKTKKEQGKEQIQNEAILTVAGLGLALPGIIKVISFLGKKGSEKINNLLGGKKELLKNSEQWFQELIEAAEKLHHLYLKPIESIIKNVFRVQDPDKARKIANLLFHVIVAAMLFYSGIGAIKAFKSKELSHGFLESALSAVKTGELQTFISSYIAKIE